MNIERILNICVAGVFFSLVSCSGKGGSPKPAISDTGSNAAYTAPVVSTGFSKGADVSWVTQMEASGVKFYNKTGSQQDLFLLLRSLGFNSVRLRAWVNPANGWCNTADVVAKAIRAKNAGFKIMIDFHYSDTWADPGHQSKPVAWAPLDFNTLVNTLSNYTTHVMDTLKANGILPEWAQTGNETNDGMLWEDGRASANMANFAALITAGYNAIKSESPGTKVIVHISNGFDNSLFRYIFDGLKANGVKWDIIGMSLYPATTNWAALNAQCLANINDMITRYGTPAMIVEAGMDASAPSTSRSFLTDIITKVNGVPNGNGLGVFYWEPEAYNWQGYGLGAFDTTGKPTEALDAFGN